MVMFAIKKILCGAVLLLAFPALVPSDPIGPPSLIWQNPQRNYAGFDQIKPVIANNGPESVFLSSLSQDGYPILERWNDKTHLYEDGKHSAHALSGHPASSIEIKSNTEQEIGLNWKSSVDDPSNPTYFIVDKTLEHRPIAGKYRFFFLFSPRPWVAGSGHDPGGAYLSGNFVIGEH
jgi:hypothetical protein